MAVAVTGFCRAVGVGVVTAEILVNSVLGIGIANTSPYSFVENIVASSCFVYKSLQQVLLAFLVSSIGLVL